MLRIYLSAGLNSIGILLLGRLLLILAIFITITTNGVNDSVSKELDQGISGRLTFFRFWLFIRLNLQAQLIV